MFTDKGLSLKCQQPPLKPEEKEVPCKKIKKFFEQKYIASPTSQIRSLIKYFAVPKGLQDWRIVFHAGVNHLNNCVWVPLFCLPTVNSLLQIMDEEMLMLDIDDGKMS